MELIGIYRPIKHNPIATIVHLNTAVAVGTNTYLPTCKYTNPAVAYATALKRRLLAREAALGEDPVLESELTQ